RSGCARMGLLRPPVPTGETSHGRAANPAMRGEGSSGNARATRVWKGDSTPPCSSGSCVAPESEHELGHLSFWSRLELSTFAMSLTDKFGRQITDLRISVTDRCNFRCVYCRSADPENHVPSGQLLEWDE